MSQLYTRRGDDGTSALGNGKRCAKSDVRFRVLGALDELSACCGLARTRTHSNQKAVDFLVALQHHLIELMGYVSLYHRSRPDFAAMLRWLENECDRFYRGNETKLFVLPGGENGAAELHLARTVCRRAELEIVDLLEQQQQQQHSADDAMLLQVVNRLSSTLFALALYLESSSRLTHPHQANSFSEQPQ